MPFHNDRVAQIRHELGLSQFGLAKELGTTPQTVNNWEHQHSTPSIKALDRLYLFCRKNDIAPPDFWTPPQTDL